MPVVCIYDHLIYQQFIRISKAPQEDLLTLKAEKRSVTFIAVAVLPHLDALIILRSLILMF